jgi:hypothetical protein
VQRKILVTIICLGVLATLGCDAPDYGERGSVAPIHPVEEASHPGWGFPNCTLCHSLDQVHEGDRTIGQCSRCHGGNGAPPITEDHPGWQLIDCGSCHPTGTHEGAYSFTDCGGCHGGNGAPLRPENHWIEKCNDCHADGTLPWNDCSHDGLQVLAPDACLNCHR